MQWNHSRCESCGHNGETMTFGGGPSPKLTCPKCKSAAIKYLGYPVWRNGRTEYQPDIDPSREAKLVSPK